MIHSQTSAGFLGNQNGARSSVSTGETVAELTGKFFPNRDRHPPTASIGSPFEQVVPRERIEPSFSAGQPLECERGPNTWLALRETGLAECFLAHARSLFDAQPRFEKERLFRAMAERDGRFSHDAWEQLPIGLFCSHSVVEKGLRDAGFSPEVIAESRLLADRRLPGRLVGPIRDERGRIYSFWAWHPEDLPPRYIFWKGDRNASYFGRHGPDLALGTVLSGRDEIILVEDLPEALLLQSHGMVNVGAIGGQAREMTRKRWERLAASGVRHVTLLERSTADDRSQTLAALDNAFKASQAPSVYVLPWERLPGAGDLTQLARSCRQKTIYTVVRRERIDGYRFKALAIIERHRRHRSFNEHDRRAALNEAIEFYSRLHRPELDSQFATTIIEELGLAEEAPRVARKPIVQIPIVAESPTYPKAAPSLRPQRLHECELHSCGETTCFCFD